MNQIFENPEEALAHYGVKGMRWGVRKDEALSGVHPRTAREARRDAKEYTQAKMFYGEGAGTRRKLINKSVESKAKRDPSYKKAFDHYVDQTDMSKRAAQARSERRNKDVSKSVKKTAKGVHHILNGNSQYANAAAAVAVGGYMYARKTGADKVIKARATQGFYQAKRFATDPKRQKQVNDFLNNMNVRRG